MQIASHILLPTHILLHLVKLLMKQIIGVLPLLMMTTLYLGILALHVVNFQEKYLKHTLKDVYLMSHYILIIVVRYYFQNH